MTVRQVALLRGINVGRASRVAMADLRALFETLGYREVSTLLNSGNVAFTASGGSPGAAAAQIEKALVARLGLSSRVTVLTAEELATIIARNPLIEVADDPSRLLIAVFAKASDRPRLLQLSKKDWAPEALAVGTRAAYLWCSGGILKSPLWEGVGRALGDAVTSRNWSTMLKLHALAGGGRS